VKKHNYFLTEDQRQEILRRFKAGESPRTLADEYGCSHAYPYTLLRRDGGTRIGKRKLAAGQTGLNLNVRFTAEQYKWLFNTAGERGISDYVRGLVDQQMKKKPHA
jgi:hypothetical protein